MLINRSYYQFADIELEILNRRVVGFTSIDYTDSNERAKVRGAARGPIGRTSGEYDAEASVEILRPHFDDLVVLAGDRFYDVVFPIVVRYGGRGQPLVVDELVRCQFKNRGNAHGQGTDALKVKLDLELDGIIFNGRLPFPGFER